MNTHVGLSGQILPDDMAKDINQNNNNSPKIDKKWLKWIAILCGVIAVGAVILIVIIKFSGGADDTKNADNSESAKTLTQSSVIDTTAGQALVILDGKSTSRFTPFSLSNLKDGKHSVWLSNEKGDWRADINMKNKGVESISAVMGSQDTEKISEDGEIFLSSNPIGASILLDDEQLNQVTPSRIENLSPGNHKVSLALDGYSLWEEEITVVSGTSMNFSAILNEIEYINEDDEISIMSEFIRVNDGWRKFENLVYNIKGEIPESWNIYELNENDFALLYPDIIGKAERQDAEILIVFDDKEDTEPVMTINVSSLSEGQLIENMINFYGDQVEIEDAETENSVDEEVLDEEIPEVDNFVNGKILGVNESQFTIITGAEDSYNFLISYTVDENIFSKFTDAFQILEDAENIEDL